MKKLAIVGSESRTRGNAPYDDPDYEIWVMNEAAQQSWMSGKRWDACFQLHRPEVYRNPNNWVNKEHWNWLQEVRDKTIYMQDVDPLVPCSVRYPLDEIIKWIPGADMRWHQPPENPHADRKTWMDLTGAYMLALAIYLGYMDIEVYGMDLASNTEYNYQLGCWRFWVGIALGMGHNLVIKCSVNDFGSNRLYGYDGEIQIPQAEFERRVEELTESFRKADWELHKAKDRVQQAVLEQKFDKLAGGLILDWQTANMAAGIVAGALGEAESFEARMDMISRQEFERRSAQAQQDGETIKAQMYATGGKTEYVFNLWRQTGRSEALNQFRHFLNQQMEYAYDAGAQVGRFQENIRYLTEYDKLLTAAGGQKTLAALTGVKETA